MEKLSKASEARLLSAVHDVCGLVDDSGYTPDDAVVKVARDMRLPPGFVPLVTSAFNVGRVNAQRQAHDSIMDKYAELPLADISKVLQTLYPAEVTTPAAEKNASDIAADYSRPPRLPARAPLVKAASAPPVARPVPPEVRMARATSRLAAEKRAWEEARHQAGAAKDRLIMALAEASDYFKFKKAGQDRLPFHVVSANVAAVHGQPGTAVMDYIYARNRLTEPREKAAAFTIYDAQAAPYNLIADCVAAVHDAQEKMAAFEAQDAASAAVVTTELRPHLRYEQPDGILGPRTEKTAAVPGNLFWGAMGGALSSGIKQVAPSTDELVQGALGELQDPEHESKLRSIKARADLSDFMAHDPQISGYDPEEVLKAYNELSELAPRASAQPAMIRSWLHKRLAQGRLEPFEAGEYARTESMLQANPKTAEILVDDSILR